ncbi:MAG: Rieske 2Fe-2S domain-containing protein [Planctomycetota bacterium]|nr:Rieske 2Fe-2S domain-containing protein [Planctomycetota bacterium]MDA1251264.1 Rieske 2Fe-2S domain-containing protein [Planctomycetota bacterium]
MFLHQERLPQLLPSDAYHSQASHETECQALYEDAWHPVAVLDQVRGEGDFVTIEFQGRPVILWRTGGTLRAFLNVCPHRFSRITAQSNGTTETMRCSYHGWEFEGCGQTKRIPESIGFRPFEKRPCLTSFRVESCGQLVFLCVSKDTPPLADWLGSVAADLEELFSEDRCCFDFVELSLAANWKIIVENAIESYHLESVHTKTFRQNPAADACSHFLRENGSSFRSVAPPADRWQRIVDSVVYRALGLKPDTSYSHHLVHPSLMAGRAGMFSWCHFVTPTQPGESRMQMWMFMERGRQSLLTRPLEKVMRIAARRFTMRAIAEDAAICAEVQTGLNSRQIPDGGWLSPREERIWHLQQYVADRTGVSELSSEESSPRHCA